MHLQLVFILRLGLPLQCGKGALLILQSLVMDLRRILGGVARVGTISMITTDQQGLTKCVIGVEKGAGVDTPGGFTILKCRIFPDLILEGIVKTITILKGVLCP